MLRLGHALLERRQLAERTRPSRNARNCMMKTSANSNEPNVSQKRSAPRFTFLPEAASCPSTSRAQHRKLDAAVAAVSDAAGGILAHDQRQRFDAIASLAD